MRFDIVEIADLRFPGGTSAAISHEIRTLSEAGYLVGLCHVESSILRAKRSINPLIADRIECGEAELIEDAEAPVKSKLALFHNPYTFSGPQPSRPLVSAEQAIIVAHQPPRNRVGTPYYSIDAVGDAVACWYLPALELVQGDAIFLLYQ